MSYYSGALKASMQHSLIAQPAVSFPVRGRTVGDMPFLTLFRGAPARPSKRKNVQSFVFWVWSPWIRYKLRKLRGFDGRETYKAQLKREREIEVLEDCLLHS